MGQSLDRDAAPVINAHPGPGGNVGDAVLIRQIFVVGQMAVEHLEQATPLLLITLDGGGDLLRKVAIEDVGLPHHGPDPAHLEHQPLDGLRAAFGIGGQQLARFLRQIDEDGPRLEHGEIVVIPVNNGWNAAIGVDGEKLRLF